jgi:hypothetical protein
MALCYGFQAELCVVAQMVLFDKNTRMPCDLLNGSWIGNDPGPKGCVKIGGFCYWLRPDIHEWCEEQGFVYALRYGSLRYSTVSISMKPQALMMFKLRWWQT